MEEIRLTESEAKALIRAAQMALDWNALFDKAALRRAQTKIEMALNCEKLSAE